MSQTSWKQKQAVDRDNSNNNYNSNNDQINYHSNGNSRRAYGNWILGSLLDAKIHNIWEI